MCIVKDNSAIPYLLMKNSTTDLPCGAHQNPRGVAEVRLLIIDQRRTSGLGPVGWWAAGGLCLKKEKKRNRMRITNVYVCMEFEFHNLVYVFFIHI